MFLFLCTLQRSEHCNVQRKNIQHCLHPEYCWVQHKHCRKAGISVLLPAQIGNAPNAQRVQTTLCPAQDSFLQVLWKEWHTTAANTTQPELPLGPECAFANSLSLRLSSAYSSLRKSQGLCSLPTSHPQVLHLRSSPTAHDKMTEFLILRWKPEGSHFSKRRPPSK